MELSSRLISKLKFLSDNDKFSFDSFNSLVSKAFDSFDLNEKFDLKFDYKQIGNYRDFLIFFYSSIFKLDKILNN
jgi:hypothetical protein